MVAVAENESWPLVNGVEVSRARARPEIGRIARRDWALGISGSFVVSPDQATTQEHWYWNGRAGVGALARRATNAHRSVSGGSSARCRRRRGQGCRRPACCDRGEPVTRGEFLAFVIETKREPDGICYTYTRGHRISPRTIEGNRLPCADCRRRGCRCGSHASVVLGLFSWELGRGPRRTALSVPNRTSKN